MAIDIEFTTAGLAASLGVSEEELIARVRAMNAGQPQESPAVPAVPVAATPARFPERVMYRYTIGSSRSGVCAICAQYAGVLTTGDGSDGVPTIPVHNNCVCTLTPVEFDIFGTDVRTETNSRYEWLESLTNSELREVLGEARQRLVSAGIVEIPDLYDEYGRLKLLSDLDIDPATGWLSTKQASVITRMNPDELRSLARRGEIRTYRVSSTEWLFDADWVRGSVGG